MSDIYPLVIVKDRYNGTYSGGKWTAWNLNYVPSKVDADDSECIEFFSTTNIAYGRGETPEEAIDDLKFFIQYGKHMSVQRIKPVSESTEDEEEEKMEPTSVWKIEDIDKIWMSQEGDKMSLELKSKDDLTKIILTGEVIRNHNDNFPIILKSDMEEAKDTISSLKRENEKLEKELNEWKKEVADCLKLRDEAQKEAYKLKKENEKHEEKIKKLEHDDMLDKNAADYWSKEHDILLERFAKLQVENEKSKEENERVKENLNSQHEMIKELNQKNLKLQEEYKALKNIQNNVRLHGMDFTPDELVNRIKELEVLKTPTIENFADEIPSTRADILDQAKKCVCGQREQDYGTPESNFQLIADLWNGYLGLCENGDGIPIFSIKSITPTDVSMMMALLKIARIKNGGSGDSFVDLAGYAACGGEIWAGEKKNKDQK